MSEKSGGTGAPAWQIQADNWKKAKWENGEEPQDWKRSSNGSQWGNPTEYDEYDEDYDSNEDAWDKTYLE